MTTYYTNALNSALQQLNNCLNLRDLVQHLDAQSTAIGTKLRDTVLNQILAFSESGNPDILPQLSQHIHEHTNELLRLLGGGSIGDFKFVHNYAKRRAEQYFPLEATLHAYRCSHKVFSAWIREATLGIVPSPKSASKVISAAADFMMEYTDAVSTNAASTYVTQTRLLADVAGDQRMELLSILLGGYDESDGRVAKTLRDAGFLGRRQSFCVILAQSIDPAEMLNPARARRLVDYVDNVLSHLPGRRLVDIHRNKVTMLFSHSRRLSGWSAPQTSLAKKVTTELLKVGPAVRMGISNDVPSTSNIPTAYREAALALEIADVSHRVIQFSAIPIQQLLLHLAGEEFQRILPPWTNAFFQANHKSGGDLIHTLRAYAATNMNASKAAAVLSIHPNTIYSRLEKIVTITGLDAKSYNALTELLIVADSGIHSE